MAARYVVPFRELDLGDLNRVGGKNASLGEMIQQLSPLGVRVPDGFAVTAEAYRAHVARGGLDERINTYLDALDASDLQALAQTGGQIREWIRARPLPEPVARQIVDAYTAFSAAGGEDWTDVAVHARAPRRKICRRPPLPGSWTPT